MRLFLFLLFACCLLACHKGNDNSAVTVPPDDTTHHDTTYHITYPYATTYTGSYHVSVARATSLDDVSNDTIYNSVVLVKHSDSTSLIFYTSFWEPSIPATSYSPAYTPLFRKDSFAYSRNASGDYPGKYPKFSIHGDSLIVHYDIVYGLSYGRWVDFAGVKER